MTPLEQEQAEEAWVDEQLDRLADARENPPEDLLEDDTCGW